MAKRKRLNPWFGDSEGHRRAALLGWRRRKGLEPKADKPTRKPRTSAGTRAPTDVECGSLGMSQESDPGACQAWQSSAYDRLAARLRFALADRRRRWARSFSPPLLLRYGYVPISVYWDTATNLHTRQSGRACRLHAVVFGKRLGVRAKRIARTTQELRFIVAVRADHGRRSAFRAGLS